MEKSLGFACPFGTRCAAHYIVDISSGIRTVVWALDPLDEGLLLHRQTAEFIRSLLSHGVVVQPAYFLGSTQLDLPLELGGEWMDEEYVPMLEKAIQDKLQENMIEGVRPPKIIRQLASSMTHAVESLSQYSLDLGADLIVTTTHGRSGFARFVLGSFSETLMARSELPVLVLGPHVHKTQVPDKILFATDLGEESKAVFRKVLALAKFFRAEVTLFHTLSFSIEPIFQSGVFLLGGGWVPVESRFGPELQRQERRGQAWAKWGTHQGVKVNSLISLDPHSVSESILRATSEADYSLIAIEAQSGVFSASLLGSIARQVVRRAPCPVWVLPARALLHEDLRGGLSAA